MRTLRQILLRGWMDTISFFGWNRRNFLWPVLLIGGASTHMWLAGVAAMLDELTALFAWTLAPVGAVTILLLIWNISAAPLRIEKEKHAATRSALESARNQIFFEDTDHKEDGPPWFLRYVFTERECKKIPQSDGIYFLFPHRQGVSPSIGWVGGDDPNDYQIPHVWDADGVLIQRKNPKARPVQDLELSFSGAHADEADIIQKKMGFEEGYEGYTKMTRFIDECLRDPNRGWAYLLDRARRIDDVTR